jgi:hypothetical protein
MASILKFVARDVDEQHRIRGSAEGPCQIVIFPGIRYERWAEDDAAPKPTPRPKRRRTRRARPN